MTERQGEHSDDQASPPGLGGGALRGDAPSSDPLTFEKLFGPQGRGGPGEPVAQATSPQPDRPPHEQQPSDTAPRPGEPTPHPAPPIGPQDRGGPGEPATQATSPQPDRPPHEQQPSDTAPRHSHGDTPHSGPFPARPGPPWQQPRG